MSCNTHHEYWIQCKNTYTWQSNKGTVFSYRDLLGLSSDSDNDINIGQTPARWYKNTVLDIFNCQVFSYDNLQLLRKALDLFNLWRSEYFSISSVIFMIAAIYNTIFMIAALKGTHLTLRQLSIRNFGSSQFDIGSN